MEIFTKECYGLEDLNAQFFFRWYETIIRDFNIFKGMLEKYKNSSEKDELLSMLSYICMNLSKDFQEEDKLILKSTPNYFMFSFYDSLNEIPTYVLISKDYKNFLVASEEMECFDDNEFDEDERYGIYEYNYFFLENNKIRHIQISNKEYTKDYNEKFDNLMLYCETQEAEKYYDSLLSVKKLKKVIKNEENN